MKIAIAIPVKDEEPRIDELMKSLRTADVDAIIFFDDCSTDDTVEVVLAHGAHIYEKAFPPESTRMSEKRNIILQELKEYEYILFLDADERMDPYFLQHMKEIITNLDPSVSFAFKRVNLPGGINYPDLQVRLMKNIPDLEWRGKVHDRVYSKSKDKALVDILEDISDFITDQNEYYCILFSDYPMIHLSRRTDSLGKRPWW